MSREIYLNSTIYNFSDNKFRNSIYDLYIEKRYITMAECNIYRRRLTGQPQKSKLYFSKGYRYILQTHSAAKDIRHVFLLS